MREIKFRAWWKEKGIMIDEYIEQGRSGGVYVSRWDAVVSDLTLMQYTGLKDGEGTDIYEGDILSYENRISSKKILVVEWSQWDAMVNFGGIRVDYATKNGTVIGNVYDNPELLEENK